MEHERWQHLRQLFQAALERDPGEWPELLAASCGDDADLRSEIESLLAAHQEAGGFLSGQANRAEATALEGRRLGPYQLAHRLGSGGMGEVYLAFRADQEFRQKVAIKVLGPGFSSAELIRRFRTERQILASLEHPNIARLLDGGTTEEGIPYLVMEHVEGQAIDAFCEGRALSLGERLELFRTVCSAVQFAHRNLVVHRDLKPSNILVTEDGTPKLLDFGIAKLLDPEISSSSSATTVLGLQPMTPDYASPEQICGERVTTASDVWSLGVLLYELLTGCHPYRSRASSLAAMRRLVTEEEPERPSLALAHRLMTAGTIGFEDGRLRRRLEGDLDNIVLKALRKDPERRYASVEQLAEDIRRHLEGLPVLARRGTLAYRMGKFVRRHRVGVAAASALLLSALGFAVAMGFQAARLARERDRAEQETRRAAQETRRAEQVTAFLTRIFEVSDPWKTNGATVTAREILDAGARRLHTELAEQPEVRADLTRTVGVIYSRLGLLSQAAPLLESALRERRRLLGRISPKVAESLNDLGLLHEQKGELAAAAAHYRQALAIRRRLFGPEHPDVAQSLSDLAGILWATGQLKEAEAAFRDALALRRHRFGNEHPDVAKSLNNLGIVLLSEGRYTEAEGILRQALALRRKLVVPSSVEAADGLNNLAIVLQAQGRPREAEPLYREALKLWTSRFGSRHPKTASGYNNVGFVLLMQERYREAEPLLREALAQRRELLGHGHPEAAQTLENLAVAALGRGDPVTAESRARESLSIRHMLFGEEHPSIADSLRILGLALSAQGRREPAESLLRQAVSLRRKLLGEMHPQVAGALEDLAVLLLEKGDLRGGEAAAREALKILGPLGSAALPDMAEAEGILGESLVRLGRFSEAEPLLLHSRAILTSERTEAYSRARKARERVAALYETWGRHPIKRAL